MSTPENMPPGAEAMASYAAELGAEAERYWARNRGRFAELMNVVDRLAQDRQVARVLDIGASFQTRWLAHRRPDWQIDTLGFEDRRFTLPAPSRHWDFDLNVSDQPNRPAAPAEGYDLILFLEVIEHLHTAPRLVLAALREWMRPGGLMVVSTPNALWLKHRIKLLTGRHPFEQIREDRGNPGHFREYTAPELAVIAQGAGLAVEQVDVRCLYGFTGAKDRVYARIASWLGPSFCRDMTLVLRRPD